MSPSDAHAVAEQVDARLTTTIWDLTPAARVNGEVSAAAEVAVFALNLAGKRRQARFGGRFSRVVVRFALAACVALASVASACDAPSASPEETQTAINALPGGAAADVTISAPPRASPAQFTGLVLLDPGSAAQPWALSRPACARTAPLPARGAEPADGEGTIISADRCGRLRRGAHRALDRSCGSPPAALKRSLEGPAPAGRRRDRRRGRDGNE